MDKDSKSHHPSIPDLANKKLFDLFSFESAPFSLYSHILKLKSLTYHHSFYPSQPVYAYDDYWEALSLDNYFQDFPFRGNFPKIITLLDSNDKMDVLIQLLEKKHTYLQNLENRRLQYKYGNTEFKKVRKDVMQCSKFMLNAAKLLEKDPDKYFFSKYNWYYAGNGNAQVIKINSIEYLLQSKYSALYLSEINKDGSIQIDYTFTYNLPDNLIILETICSSHIVALRTKNKIFLLKIVTTEDQICVEKLRVLESEHAYTSISFDLYHMNILYLTVLNNMTTIVNLDRMVGKPIILKDRPKELYNNWNAVMSNDRFTYAHVCPKQVTLYDKRYNETVFTFKERHLQKLTNLQGCDSISCAKFCPYSNLLYVGTNHHLFALDVRSHTKQRPHFVQKWVHGMESSPTYMNITEIDHNKEIITLASQYSHELKLLTRFSKENGLPQSITMPYQPPSMLDTLHQAHKKNLCYDIYNPIDHRLKGSITGLDVIKRDDNLIIFKQNVYGDIIANTLYPTDSTDMTSLESSIEDLLKWSKNYKLKTKPLKVTDVQTINWAIFKKIPDHMELINQKYDDKYNEEEIYDIINSGDVDAGILDAWKDDSHQYLVNDDLR